MRIKFLHPLRDELGRGEVVLENISDVAELLEKLKILFRDNLEDVVLKDGMLKNDLILLVDGVNIRNREGIKTPLTSDSEVTIFSQPVGG